jgi:transaldolase
VHELRPLHAVRGEGQDALGERDRTLALARDRSGARRGDPSAGARALVRRQLRRPLEGARGRRIPTSRLRTLGDLLDEPGDTLVVLELGVDGWVSLEVSPRIAYDPESTIKAAVDLHAKADRPNLFIKIPATAEGIPAIEEAIFAGVPVNVTLLFSREQYLAAADAYLRGIERRVDAGLDPFVGSVASVFVSRWDTAHESTERPDELHNQLGIAMAKRTYRAYRAMLDSDRWRRLANEGARPQRLLWASTGTKDPAAPDVLYVRALAAPFTVNTLPEKTLLAFGDHGVVGDFLPTDGGNAEDVIARFTAAGVDVDALAARLQQEGADAFVASWDELIENIGHKTRALTAA